MFEFLSETCFDVVIRNKLLFILSCTSLTSKVHPSTVILKNRIYGVVKWTLHLRVKHVVSVLTFISWVDPLSQEEAAELLLTQLSILDFHQVRSHTERVVLEIPLALLTATKAQKHTVTGKRHWTELSNIPDKDCYNWTAPFWKI